MKEIYGLTDIPVQWDKDNIDSEDLLEVKKYLIGLYNFIINCPTPMSIAVQGDWGTGKTSIINYLKKRIDVENKSDNVYSVYFNTWQYAQFNMEKSLYFSFVMCLINAISKASGKEFQDSLKKNIKKLFWAAGKSIINNTGIVDVDKFEEVLQYQEDLAEQIATLKFNFEKEIIRIVGENGRMVIFIDDLDRLNPNVAVELLEVIKLFMDVKHCVFVLAIDYDVVVQGVRQKFGQEVSLEKCRSFFDKIIQLPFRMPTEAYNLDKMIKNILDGIVDNKYCNSLADYTYKTIGANPRTIKRLINSFLLIKSVFEVQIDTCKSTNKMNDYEKAFLYCSLCLQMSDITTYLLISEFDSDDKDIDLFNDKFELIDTEELIKLIMESGKNEKIADNIISNLKSLENALQNIKDVSGDKNIKYENFLNIIRVSSVTTVSAVSSKKEKGDNVIVKNVVFDGDSTKSVNKVTDAMQVTIEYIINRSSTNIDEIVNNMNFLSYENTNKSIFRTVKEVSIDGRTVYIGTSTGFDVKTKQINNLCDFLQIQSGLVKWLDDRGQVKFINN